MSVRIDGIANLEQVLGNIADPERLERQMHKACALVEGEAKGKAPKGAGDLRRSIEYRVDKSPGEVEGVVFTPLEYAPYVEFGTGLFAEEHGRQDVPWSYQDDEGNWHSTSGMPPSPYMRPALAENRQRVVQILKEGLHG